MLNWDLETFAVRRKDREPLLKFMLDALRDAGCEILSASEPNKAPFRFAFADPNGERFGVVAYAYLANSTPTKNRPLDECRFQVKYGSKKDGRLHDVWQDPAGHYTTLFLGIDLERGLFVGADPVLHSPTKFFISIEYKKHHAAEILRDGWLTWERVRRGKSEAKEPVEALVGGTASSFRRYIRFEHEALGLDQGPRQRLAERFHPSQKPPPIVAEAIPIHRQDPGEVHRLAAECGMSEAELLTLIADSARVKMNVRGRVAEWHLERELRKAGIPCKEVEGEGKPDLEVQYKGRTLLLECKNVLRKIDAKGVPMVDFQRTRSSKSDPSSRFYSPKDFDVVAACLHSFNESWEFKFFPTRRMQPHAKFTDKLSTRLRVDAMWSEDITKVLEELCA